LNKGGKFLESGGRRKKSNNAKRGTEREKKKSRKVTGGGISGGPLSPWGFLVRSFRKGEGIIG